MSSVWISSVSHEGVSPNVKYLFDLYKGKILEIKSNLYEQK